MTWNWITLDACNMELGDIEHHPSVAWFCASSTCHAYSNCIFADNYLITSVADNGMILKEAKLKIFTKLKGCNKVSTMLLLIAVIIHRPIMLAE